MWKFCYRIFLEKDPSTLWNLFFSLVLRKSGLLIKTFQLNQFFPHLRQFNVLTENEWQSETDRSLTPKDSFWEGSFGRCRANTYPRPCRYKDNILLSKENVKKNLLFENEYQLESVFPALHLCCVRLKPQSLSCFFRVSFLSSWPIYPLPERSNKTQKLQWYLRCWHSSLYTSSCQWNVAGKLL